VFVLRVDMRNTSLSKLEKSIVGNTPNTQSKLLGIRELIESPSYSLSMEILVQILKIKMVPKPQNGKHSKMSGLQGAHQTA